MSQTDLSPHLQELLESEGLFEGKYRLKKRLGQGSFATVIHAEHEAMGRDVALKFLRPDVLKSHPEVAERFLLEVKLASRLTSPHTVTIFDFGQTDEEVPFMVLEFVDGRELDYAIEKYGALGVKRSIRIVLQILDSLEEAHALGIIHRDLKPANIMVGKPKAHQKVHAKVLDFGVAKLLEKAEEKLVTKSGRQSTQFIGTPRYMSPEQILGQKVSAASDLYSLGLIFYEMCTGRDSIEDGNVAQVAQMHLDSAPLPLEGLADLPRPIQEIIRKATSRRVEDRYGSAAEFRLALQEAVELGKRKHRKATKADSSAERLAKEAREAKEAARKSSEVFSGKGYVALPEESETSLARESSAAGRRGSRPLTPGPQPPRRQPSPIGGPSRKRKSTGGGSGHRKRAGSGGGELDLDLDSVNEQQRQQQRRRHYESMRQNDKSQSRSREQRLWAGSIVTILFAGGLGFVIVGGALDVLATPMRVVAALLPVGLALLWSFFSQNAYPDLIRRRIVPWAKRSASMVLIFIVILMLLIPGTAAQSLQNDALWFMMGPEALQPQWFGSMIEAICEGVAWLMVHASRWIPWAA